MPSPPVPQLRFICESPSNASNHPHGSSAKPAYLIKADALRNYCLFSPAGAWDDKQGVITLPRRRSIVSDDVKYEIARELGFADKINVEGDDYDYGNITTRQAGLIVRGLIEKAERAMADQLRRRGQ